MNNEAQAWSMAFSRLRGGLHDLGQSTRSPELLSWLTAKNLPSRVTDLDATTLEKLADAIERRLIDERRTAA